MEACTDTETRQWYTNYYDVEDPDNNGRCLLAAEQTRTRVNLGAFTPWAPDVATFPTCSSRIDGELVVPTDAATDVETGTRTYWQDDVIRADGDEPACLSETQKRQRTAAGPGPWTKWFGAYAFVECSHVQTRVRWESAGGASRGPYRH